MKTSRAYLDISINGHTVTADLADETISFTYTDNASDNVDDIDLTIENRSKKWLHNWFPTKGDIIAARICTENWTGDLSCGSFTVDEVEMSGRPLVVGIKGLAMPVAKGFSEEKRTRNWEKADLKQVITTLAANSNIPLAYTAKYDMILDVVSQQGVSDKAFLYSLCQKYGLGMKLYSNRIVIYDPTDLGRMGGVVKLTEQDFLSWSCKSMVTETAYSGCSVTYTTPEGEVLEYLYQPTDTASKTYRYNTRVGSIAEAERVAKSTLRNLNMKEVTFSGSLPGNALLVSGMNVELEGFGNFDGRYFIDKAGHSLASGYTTDLEMHKEVE